jgi:hypothetical protein
MTRIVQKFEFILIMFLLFSFVLSSQSNVAHAYSNSHQVSITTGDRNVGGIATARIDYTLNVEITHDDSAEKGETQAWNVIMYGGKMQITIVAAGKTIPIEKDLPIGERISIPAMTGVDVDLFSTANAPISVTGPASVNVERLRWSSSDAHGFALSISKDANNGETITVRIPVNVAVNMGLSIGFFGFSRSVSSLELGSFQASPVIEETIVVGQSAFVLSLPIIIGIVAAGGGGGAAAILLRRKMQAQLKQIPSGQEYITAQEETFPAIETQMVAVEAKSFSGLPCHICSLTLTDSDSILRCPNCNKVFHHDCLGAFIELNHTCPSCNHTLSTS